MLRLILGKAGTGKTAAIIKEIDAAVKARQGDRLLIVPEQYSHEAERELCAVCGDSLSLYGEVFSFTGLARRVMARMGGGAATYLDKGGRLLCMARALGGLKLEIYSAAKRRAEMQAALLSALDELKSACVSPEQLEEAAARAGEGLGDKLRELALIYSAYDAVASNGRADPADRLSILAQQIAQGGVEPSAVVYVDGFVDFTRQEHEVLAALLKQGVQLTVCLTADALDGTNEIYELSRRSARRLMARAEELGQPVVTEYMTDTADKAGQLSFFTDNMFSFSAGDYTGEGGRIELYRAESILAECELAAAKALELVREKGCRWRDIAVAARGFEDYRGQLESTFALYDVPLFTARKSSLLLKPLPSLISGAYEVLQGGWDVDDVTGYIRTGLTGLSPMEADELTDYLYKWQLRAGAWEQPGPWRQHPKGYGAKARETEEQREATAERLEEINALRRRVAEPLMRFRDRAAAAETAQEQAAALAELLAELKLPQTLSARALELEELGKGELAQEYRQLWELVVGALEQSAAILGDTRMNMEEFGTLFTRMLSMYDTGAIPVSLDRVSAGDFDRMRRRSIKHLIVLGCSDDRLPRAGAETGVFSEEERQRLLELDIDIGGGESELWREFSLIYNCLTLPSESLTMSYPLADAEGGQLRASFVLNRAKALFKIDARSAELSDLRLSAPSPALLLAAQALKGGGARARAAADYFRRTAPERLESLKAAAEMDRGQLSPKAVEELYGSRLSLSASRIDKLSACRFAYFCRYGLRAERYEPLGFSPSEMGTFVHYVLEKTVKEVRDQGGFRAVTDEALHALADKYIEEYEHNELGDLKEKSPRFAHLFRRLCGEVHQIVLDTAQELRSSDFEPWEFELNFSETGEDGERRFAPLRLGEGAASLALSGVADRVDVWRKDGKLFLRVVDYKTGKKDFSLPDLWYGMDMQMLLYLMLLEANGEAYYGCPVLPAGVMYLPARDEKVSLDLTKSPDLAEGLRKKALRRKGFVLEDAEIKEAWEHGEDKVYTPMAFKPGGGEDPNAAVTPEGLELITGHIKKLLSGMADRLKAGDISAEPYYRSPDKNACRFCEYSQACQFNDGENGEGYQYRPKMDTAKFWAMLEGERTDE